MYNDLHGNVDLWRTLHARVADQRFDFALLNGDITNSMKDEAQLVDTFLAPCGELFAGATPIFYARGNHETRGAMARDMKRYLGMPGDRYHYAFSRGPARFIVLDTGEDKEDDHAEYSGMNEFDPYRQMQEKFLAAEIESPAWKNARWRIAVIHIPPYYGRDWHTTTYLRRTWQQLLNAGKTDLSLSGHNHRCMIAAPNPTIGHHHPIIIGGSCKPGEATVTTIDLNDKNLRVKMIRDNGDTVGELVL
jgi:3',5'-cyclic AMP phosphodiesterase CpdA